MQQRTDTVQCPTCGMRISKTLAKCPQDGTLLLGNQPTGAFAERYEFLEALGAGGMSVIYKGRQRALNRIVAIKMMHEHLMNEHTVRRFQQEGQAASSLDHPNIVKVHDFGLTDTGQPYMVMDLVEGKALSQVLEELGSLPTTQCLIIFIDICDALIHAHDKGILHRDLKPSNIMLATTMERPTLAKLVDFGIAKMMDDDADSPMQKLTQTGELFGSPLYMSPEQCLGRKVDRRSDIYSFGCLMFECLTGRVPIRGDRMVDTITKQMTAKAPLLSEVRADKTFPPRLEDVVDKCLAKNPDARFKNFDEVKAQLVAIQQELDAGLMKEKSLLRKVLRAVSEVKMALLLLVCSFLILGALAYGVNNVRSSHEQERKKVTMEKAKFLALMQPRYITTPILSECLSEDSGLTSLDLSDSEVNDDGMLYVNLQSDLKELHLDNTKIGDKGLSALKDLHQLERLYLKKSAITDDGLKALKNFPHLTLLALNETRVDRNGLKYLAPLKALRELDISNTNLKGPCLEDLAGLPIEILYLNDTPLNAEDLKSIKSLSKLKKLEMTHTGLPDSAISALEPLAHLEKLVINENSFGDNCAQFLAKLKHLKILDISDTKITEKGIETIAKSLNLYELSLRGLNIKWDSIGVLQNFPNLRALDVSYNEDIDDAAVDKIAKIKSIEMLNLTANHDKTNKNKLTPKTAVILAEQMPQLRELRLNNQTNVNEKISLTAIAKLKHLTLLEYDGVNIDDDVSKHQNLPLLRRELGPGCRISNKR